MLENKIVELSPVLSTPISYVKHDEKPITPTQLQQDFNYYRAQKVAEAMLECGLISLVEYNKLTELNLKSFSPFLAEIMT